MIRSPMRASLALAVASAVLAAGGSTGPSSNRQERGRFLQALLDETNRARRSKGRAALSASADLAAAAQAHAEDMLARNYFAHVSPEGDDATHRVQRESPKVIVLEIRENIRMSEGEGDDPIGARAAAIVDGWMHSRGHRENLLHKDVTDVGFGVAGKERDGAWVEIAVQVLGSVVGRWERAPKEEIRTPARWPLRTTAPVDFFLDDVASPRKDYRDPSQRSRYWIGGVPLVLTKDGRGEAIEIPGLDPGPYRLLAKRKGEEGYQELRELRVLSSDIRPLR